MLCTRGLAIVILLCTGNASSPVFADDTMELITDRPDQTESSAVVPDGYLQLELGSSYTEESGESRALTYPELLVRWGVAEKLELRFGLPSWTTEREGPNTTRSNDTGLGFKLALSEESGMWPEIALLAGASLPTGADGNSSERIDPSFRFAFSHTLSPKFGLAYNLGVAWETELESPTDRDTGSIFQYTVALGTALTDRMGAFIELFGDAPMSAPGGTAHSFDGGFTFLIRPNIQWDIFAGFGLNDEADDWFIGSGFSIRLPG